MLELVENKYQENIIGLSREEIGDRFLSLGLQKFRIGQVWHWLYHKGATSFEEMTTSVSYTHLTLPTTPYV